LDGLVQLVAKKAGISTSQAKKAVDTVMDFLNDKLPEPLDSQVKQAMEGGQVAGVVDDVTIGLGGMLGKKDY
jgi:hypothetical protein